MSDAGLDADIEKAKTLFAPYLASHDHSKVQRVNRAGREQIGITKPWGEDGIVTFLPADQAALAEALNNIILPLPFTAIYHKDSRQLEVIWTAYPVPDSMKDIATRKFKVNFEGAEHECGFEGSSARLLTIATHAIPVGVSETQHRNLQSYNQHVKWQQETDAGRAAPPLGKPTSFWISNLDWDEARVTRLARHLNFYMSYYDAISPIMFIWPSKSEVANPRTRFIRDAFPENIEALAVEDDLLHFWGALKDGDAARKFVYAYRIVEYASHAFIEKSARIKTKRLLATAHEFADKKNLCDNIVATVLSAKEMDEGARIAALLADTVDTTLLWKEITRNRAGFQTSLTFDGGYVLKPIINKDDTDESFVSGGIGRFAQTARDIRNHLSHGRDRKTLTSITPTVANFRKLEPWVGAMIIVAGEVIINKNVL